MRFLSSLRLFVRLGALLLVVALIGCDPAAPGTEASTVTLRNANAATAHLLAAGESASASTELASGATRQVEVTPGARGEQRAFHLVRDGAEVDAIDCTLLQGIGPGTEVRFTAEGGLVCLRW